jgi:uracil-DNA glycosylase
MHKIAPLAAYLDSVGRNYPYGVPYSAVVAAAKPRVMFVGAVPGATSAEPYRGAAGDLLRSAIIKGMKLALTDISVVPLPQDPGIPTLSELIRTQNPQCVVCLGKEGCEAVAEVSKEQGVKEIIVTPELKTVLIDIDAKRAFWADLQKVMALLE